MGFEIDRFTSHVDVKLLCALCFGVLDIPVLFTTCKHTFCAQCILQHVNKNGTVCPVDYKTITKRVIQVVPNCLMDQLAQLVIGCNFKCYGCYENIKLDNLLMHTKNCDFNPTFMGRCPNGCDMFIPQPLLSTHDCMVELSHQCIDNELRLTKITKEMNETQQEIDLIFACQNENITEGANPLDQETL